MGGDSINYKDLGRPTPKNGYWPDYNFRYGSCWLHLASLHFGIKGLENLRVLVLAYSWEHHRNSILSLEIKQVKRYSMHKIRSIDSLLLILEESKSETFGIGWSEQLSNYFYLRALCCKNFQRNSRMEPGSNRVTIFSIQPFVGILSESYGEK